MLVMGFQKKVWMGVGGWGEFYPSFFLDFWNCLTLQSPLAMSVYSRVDRCLPCSSCSRFTLVSLSFHSRYTGTRVVSLRVIRTQIHSRNT